MAQISLYDRGTSYLSVYITGLDPSYSRSPPNDRYIDWYFNYSYVGQETINDGISNTYPIDFQGLNPGTGYPVGAVIYYTTYSGGPYTSVTLTDVMFYTLSNPRPSYFYWSSYGTGYSPQNRSVSGGIIYVYRPSAYAWNSFRLNIIDMLVYKGIIYSSDYFTSYANSFPAVSTGDAITATLYNKAGSCINDMGGSVPTVVAGIGGTGVTENYFYYLTYYLNNIS